MVGAVISGTPEAVAVIEADTSTSVTYAELEEMVGVRAEDFEHYETDLAFLFADNTIATVVDYLALRRLAVPVLMLERSTAPDRLAELTTAYEPSLLLGAPNDLLGYRRSGSLHNAHHRTVTPDRLEMEVAVSVLLPTSGSTGNPKFVQLTDDNVNINAADIVSSLDMLPDDRGLQPLPLFYSYGMSILNSHLAVGATTVLTSASPLRPEFWETVSKHSIASMPGVPYSYAMFLRAGLFDRDISSLRYMTQAGDKLDSQKVLEVHAGLSARRMNFYVMYGQTEASPRMSVLASDDLPEHPHKVGFALDHGKFTIADPDDDGVGEVLYDGPNVMIGYAEKRSDLGSRTLFGSLETGDLGYLDPVGRLAITGRLKRIAKLFGNRISLRDIESHFAFLGPVAAVEGDNRICVYHESGDAESRHAVKTLERMLKVPPRTIQLAEVNELPRTPNGKIDYRALTS